MYIIENIVQLEFMYNSLKICDKFTVQNRPCCIMKEADEQVQWLSAKLLIGQIIIK